MSFRTELKLENFPFHIDHNSQILGIGSCFADMVGERLVKYKFKALANPFGNIYNPICVHSILNPGFDLHTDNIESNKIWYSFHLHSEIHANTENQLISLIQAKKEGLQSFNNQVDTIIITYGTAWIYQLKDSGKIVANCHKQPNDLFTKRLLTVLEIEQSFAELYFNLARKGKELNILLTVSPVRHIKDTLELNSVSKSTLRIACHQLANSYSNVHYFPAYEIMMDDLRDYRFYKKDMIHPSELAEDYIWDKFSEALMKEETLQQLKELDEIYLALHHKPFHAESEQHQKFLRTLIKKIESISGVLNFDEELKFLEKQLA